VWHGQELTYAVASPAERFGSLREAYLEIHQLLARALRSLGVQASLAPRTRVAALDAGACFAQPVGGEVLVNGRKVIGSAQLRRGPALLQHGSILLHHAQRVVADLMRSNARPHPSSLPRMADDFSLADQLGRPLLAGDVAVAVARSARRCWAAQWEPVIDPDDIVRAANHHAPQFRSSTWTWAR
jgi:lipoate-protein ligase A